MQSKVKFAEEKAMKQFIRLSYGDNQERTIHKEITKAVEHIEKNAYCGVQYPKRLIPRYYIKRHNITNLWKYNLPDGWRLIYTIKAQDAQVISLLLEWFDHKDYEKRFNYLI